MYIFKKKKHLKTFKYFINLDIQDKKKSRNSKKIGKIKKFEIFDQEIGKFKKIQNFKKFQNLGI